MGDKGNNFLRATPGCVKDNPSVTRGSWLWSSLWHKIYRTVGIASITTIRKSCPAALNAVEEPNFKVISLVLRTSWEWEPKERKPHLCRVCSCASHTRASSWREMGAEIRGRLWNVFSLFRQSQHWNIKVSRRRNETNPNLCQEMILQSSHCVWTYQAKPSFPTWSKNHWSQAQPVHSFRRLWSSPLWTTEGTHFRKEKKYIMLIVQMHFQHPLEMGTFAYKLTKSI